MSINNTKSKVAHGCFTAVLILKSIVPVYSSEIASTAETLSSMQDLINRFCSASQPLFLSGLIIFIILFSMTKDDTKRAFYRSGLIFCIIAYAILMLLKDSSIITNTLNALGFEEEIW